MNRQKFLQLLALFPAIGSSMKLSELAQLTDPFSATEQMPVLFMGHGSPMNAIQENEFTIGWKNMGEGLPKPNAILCISAHWETNGTWVTAMNRPRTIHDFGGFPKALFDVQYPAPGSPSVAQQTRDAVQTVSVGLDEKWGLDHGAWSVIKHLYPDADVPVLQLSLDYRQSPAWHYALGRELAALRRKGVLIIGSGNIVHNLGMLNWQQPDGGFDWAEQARLAINQLILDGNHTQLARYNQLGREIQLSIPTPEHYLPLLYTLALKDEKEPLSFFNDKTIMGSIAMTSLRIG
jgi:4,5-DOPA dioxygenase extradiol